MNKCVSLMDDVMSDCFSQEFYCMRSFETTRVLNFAEMKDLLLNFQCFQCKKIAYTPIKCRECDEFCICKVCLDKENQTPNIEPLCKKCGSKNLKSLSKIEISIYNKMVIKCINLDCNESFKAQDIKDLENHEKGCLHRQITCKFCGDHLKFVEMEAHFKSCGKIEIVCQQGCSTTLKREDLQNHSCLKVLIKDKEVLTSYVSSLKNELTNLKEEKLAVEEENKTLKEKITELQVLLNDLKEDFDAKICKAAQDVKFYEEQLQKCIGEKANNTVSAIEMTKPGEPQSLNIAKSNLSSVTIKPLSNSKFYVLFRHDINNLCYFNAFGFETNSNGEIISQGDSISIPQPYGKCGGHYDFFSFDDKHVVVFTCPFNVKHYSQFVLININSNLNSKIISQDILDEHYIAQGADIVNLEENKSLLCDYDGNIKIIVKNNSSLSFGKLYQIENYERAFRITKLSNKKILAVSEMKQNTLLAVVLQISGFEIIEGAKYKVATGEKFRYSISIVTLADSALVSYCCNGTNYVSFLAISGNTINNIQTFQVKNSILLFQFDISNIIWYKDGNNTGILELSKNEIIFNKKENDFRYSKIIPVNDSKILGVDPSNGTLRIFSFQ